MCPENDQQLAERFKRDHNEQFNVLVRMHLSFLLHMNTEQSSEYYEKGKLKKWNIPFGKKSKNKHNDSTGLTQDVIRQLKQLIVILRDDENNLKTEGIFRRTGSIERQHDLRNILGNGVAFNFDQSLYNVHDCASVFKSILADLPEPLLTDVHFPVYCQIAEICTMENQEEKLLEAIQYLFLLLPDDNRTILKEILDLLNLVASHEQSNKMSPENLAKLFTPHLFCPRKLSPENLLKDSQALFRIMSFMIGNAQDVYKVPSKLVLEFRAHEKRQQQKANESINDAVNTVFTFTDNERTAKENEANPTETALAQLYAHIQSLPESSKKRKLVKQFNKENGHGTPLQVIRSGPPKCKSIGDSIKKHMFHKKLLKNHKKYGLSNIKASSSEEMLNSPQSTSSSSQKSIRGRLFCNKCNSSSELDTVPLKKLKTLNGSGSNSNLARKRSLSDASEGDDSMSTDNKYLTSTPACIKVNTRDMFTPNEQERESMSPITRSAQKMPRAMQETMMTPRSRKPVLLLSGTNINQLPKVEPPPSHMEDLTEELEASEDQKDTNTFKKCKSDGCLLTEPKSGSKINKSDTDAMCLTNTFREYLSSRDILTVSSPVDSSFSSRTDDFSSTGYRDLDVSEDKMTESLLYCLDGNLPDEDERCEDGCDGVKELVLKPKQFDENGKPIVFETSF